MTVLAHVVPNESTFLDHLLHPFTGLDHLAAMALVAMAIVLMVVARRGRRAATTAGTTTRIRTLGPLVAAGLALAGSVALLLLV